MGSPTMSIFPPLSFPVTNPRQCTLATGPRGRAGCRPKYLIRVFIIHPALTAAARTAAHAIRICGVADTRPAARLALTGAARMRRARMGWPTLPPLLLAALQPGANTGASGAASPGVGFDGTVWGRCVGLDSAKAPASACACPACTPPPPQLASSWPTQAPALALAWLAARLDQQREAGAAHPPPQTRTCWAAPAFGPWRRGGGAR